MKSIEPLELQNFIEEKKPFLLLDVRETFEWDFCNLGGLNIPLQNLPNHLDQLPKEKPIVILCHHGIRSSHAQYFLMRHGFENVLNLSGGIDRWSITVDSNLPRY